MIDPRFRLAYRISTCKKESVFVLVVFGFLLSLGFLTSTDINHNFDAIYDFANRYVWGVFFGLYALGNFLYYNELLHRYLALIVNVAGLFAWHYIFLSFTVFDTNIAPTEYLLLGFITIQMWVLLLISHNKTED